MMNMEYPRSIYFRIKWAFLDWPISRRKVENGHDYISQLIQRCKDLGGMESKRIVSSPLNYDGVWWFNGKDMVEIKDLLEDCGYEIQVIKQD